MRIFIDSPVGAVLGIGKLPVIMAAGLGWP